jgi:hypothetical protein
VNPFGKCGHLRLGTAHHAEFLLRTVIFKLLRADLIGQPHPHHRRQPNRAATAIVLFLVVLAWLAVLASS